MDGMLPLVARETHLLTSVALFGAGRTSAAREVARSALNESRTEEATQAALATERVTAGSFCEVGGVTRPPARISDSSEAVLEAGVAPSEAMDRAEAMERGEIATLGWVERVAKRRREKVFRVLTAVGARGVDGRGVGKRTARRPERSGMSVLRVSSRRTVVRRVNMRRGSGERRAFRMNGMR